MEKKIWNQNYIDKYNDIMDQLYLTIGDILREKLGEKVTLNYESGEVIIGILRYVGSNCFAISFGKDNDVIKYLDFDHMQSFPFYEDNNINIVAD